MFGDIIFSTLGFLHQIDWILYAIAFIIACSIFEDMFVSWRQIVYKHDIVWVLLEIKIPRETLRGPKAMDQVLASIYNLRNHHVGLKEVYWDGEVTRWFSFEIVGEQGSTRLFVRVPRVILHPFISSFYAQYPDVELIEAEEDYIDKYPKTYQELKARNYEMYGLEVTQTANPAYGLRTYVDFETKVGDEKGRIIDTMAGVIEIIGKLKPQEVVWIQFLARPDTIGDWLASADKIVDKIKSATQGGDKSGEGTTPFRLRFRTQGEEKTLKRIEDKKGKAVFITIPRLIYFAPKAIYNQDLPNRGIFGYIAQLKNNDQAIKKIDRVRTKVEGWGMPPLIFMKGRMYWKRIMMYEEYRKRYFPASPFFARIFNSHLLRWCFFHEPMLLSSEELATLYHVPTNVVLTQATMERIESKRVSAPSNLPG